jgi:hypothetical protein
VAITGQTQSRGGHAERRLYCMRLCHVYLVELAIRNQKKMKRRLLFSLCPPPFPHLENHKLWPRHTAAPCRTQVPTSNQTCQARATASAHPSSPRLDLHGGMAPNVHQSGPLGDLDTQQRIKAAFPIAFGRDIKCGPVPGPAAALVLQAERDPYWPVHCDAAPERINDACANVGEAVADVVGGDNARFGIGYDVQSCARVAGGADEDRLVEVGVVGSQDYAVVCVFGIALAFGDQLAVV